MEIQQNKNIACRIFKEQIDLVLQLPENERAEVLYKAILSVFNQIENQNDNQIENQNEYAYVSVSDSVSILSKTVFSLLKKNIVCKEFSNNYGGRRINAGRPKNQIDNYTHVIDNNISSNQNNQNIQNNPQKSNKKNTGSVSVSDTDTTIREDKSNNNSGNNINNNISTTRAHNALEVFGNSFKATDAVVGVFDKPDGTTHEGIRIKNPRLMAFIRQRFDSNVLSKVSDWAIDHNQRGHTYNATSLLKLLCKFQSNVEPTINFNSVQAEYLTFEYKQPQK